MGLRDAQQTTITPSTAPPAETGDRKQPTAPILSDNVVQAVEATTSTAEDLAKSAGSGVGRGITSLFGMGGDIETLVEAGLRDLQASTEAEKDKIRDINIFGVTGQDVLDAKLRKEGETLFPTTEQVFSGIGAVSPAAEQGLRYQPKTSAGEAAQVAGEFVGGAVGGMPSAVVKAKKMLAGMGLLGGTVGTLEEMGQAEAGTLLGVAVPLVTAALTGRPMGAEKLARRATGEDAAVAKGLMAAAKEQGMPLTTFEALGVEGVPVAQQIASSPSAAKDVRGLLQQRAETMPEALMQVSKEVFENVDPQTVNRTVDEVVTASMNRAKTTGSAIAGEAGYNAAKKDILDADTARDVYKRADKAMKSTDSTLDPDQKKKLRAQLRTILGMSVSKGKLVIKDKNILAVDKAYKAKLGELDFSNPEARNILKMVDEEILSKNPNIASGRAAYKQYESDVMKDMGQAFEEKITVGLNEGKLSRKNVDDLVSGDPATPQSVSKVANYLNLAKGQGDTAEDLFPQVVAHMIRTKAVKFDSSNPLSAGKKFAMNLRGNKGSNKRAVFNTSLDEVARSYGKTADETAAFKKAVNDRLDILEKTGDVPGFQSMPTDDAIAAFKVPKPAINKYNRALQAAEMVMDARYQRNIDALSKAMTSEKGVDILIKLGRRPQDRALKASFQSLVAGIRQNVEQSDYATSQTQPDMSEQEQQTLLPVPQQEGMGIGKPLSELNLSLLGQ